MSAQRLSVPLLLSAVLWAGGVLNAQTAPATVLPNGRQIHPTGGWIPLAPYPFALAVRPDGQQIAAPSIGFPFALNIVDHPADAHPTVLRMPPGENKDPNIEVHAGVAYSRDGRQLYEATGDSGKVRAYDATDWTKVGELSLDGMFAGRKYAGSFAATLVISPDGRFLYVLDQGNWRVVVVDVARMEVVGTAPTGADPFGIAVSPDGRRLYVTNSGMFEYRTIPGIRKEDVLHTALRFPPFGYPSKEARLGTTAEGKRIPGLGDENTAFGSSVWTYDLADPANPAVRARIRLGAKIQEDGGSTVGGAAPTGVVAGQGAVYVALAHDDQVVKLDAAGEHMLAHAELSPFRGKRFEDGYRSPLRGVMPSGLALRDGRLYVAESGIDAVGVLDAGSLRVLGHIPVGWNPSALAVSPDGATLYVINTKGRGTGPNGGPKHAPNQPSYVGSLELGSLSVLHLKRLPSIEEMTAEVVKGNTAAVDGRPALPRLRHCFLVIRENRTYDEVLGDVAGANGDPSLARYGMDGWAAENPKAIHLHVTPNLHALAARYAMSDNYDVDSDVSADGHRWVMDIDPTPFFNTAWTSNYGGRRHADAFAPEPGRRALFGGADAPMPEDEPQFGSLWEHVAAGGNGAHGILNYGEGLEIEGSEEMAGAQPEGQRLTLNAPLPKPVFDATDRRYPTFNLGIPDQFRVAEFERDFGRRIAAGAVPALIVIRLPNDHTADPRSEDGYPYRASYVADNDLALGRIVSFLSHTAIWKDSALFITEDDAQGGVDHVDAHRSVLVVASPWVIPGAVSHEHSSMGSITRTIDELLGLGPLNLEDALSGEIGGIFDTHRHLAPFQVRKADPRVFIPDKARFARPKSKKEAAELLDVDDADAIRRQLQKAAGTLVRPNSPQ